MGKYLITLLVGIFYTKGGYIDLTKSTHEVEEDRIKREHVFEV